MNRVMGKRSKEKSGFVSHSLLVFGEMKFVDFLMSVQVFIKEISIHIASFFSNGIKSGRPWIFSNRPEVQKLLIILVWIMLYTDYDLLLFKIENQNIFGNLYYDLIFFFFFKNWFEHFLQNSIWNFQYSLYKVFVNKIFQHETSHFNS